MQISGDQPRIFHDHEVQDALQELFRFPALLEGMKQFLPAEVYDLVLREKDLVPSITEFQARIILPIMKVIEKGSVVSCTASGLENLRPGEQYLFISNHRDIILDSAFLNTVLFEKGFRTGQIAIGDNLMRHRMSELIFHLNKSFVVKRSGTPMELYRYSMKLSAYIRDQISREKRDSIWIAQREGRAKDGNDRTQVALLKMLSLSAEGDLKAHFKALQIVPVAISYEYDPCDVLKAQEFLFKKADPEYKKAFAEDVQHMLLGLRGNKGRIHFHFDRPLDAELDIFDTDSNPKQQLEMLAALIDNSIHRNYQLQPINYVAADLLSGNADFAAHYTPEEYARLKAYFDQKSAKLQLDESGEGRRYLLGMYANPLVNQLAAGSQ